MDIRGATFLKAQISYLHQPPGWFNDKTKQNKTKKKDNYFENSLGSRTTFSQLLGSINVFYGLSGMGSTSPKVMTEP